MLVTISKSLQDTVQDILNKSKGGYFDVECILYSPDNPDINIPLTNINQFTIQQNFGIDYMDKISLHVTVFTKVVIQLLKNYQNLKCTLILYKLHSTTHQRLLDEDPIKFDFKAIMSNFQDILKNFNKAEILQEENQTVVEAVHSRTFDLDFELITETNYKLRQIQFNGIFKNLNMLQALHTIKSILKIPGDKFITPENPKTYDRITFPPMLNIGTGFDFLQNRYGIYSKGLAVYHLNDVLYVYPGADTTIQSESVINVYNVPETYGAGATGFYHRDSDNNIHLVANLKTQSQDMSAQSIENQGTFKVSLRTDMSLDHIREVNGDKAQFTNTNTIGCGLKNPRTISPEHRHTKYSTSSNNIFKMASDLAQFNCTLVMTGFNFSDPNLFVPGQRVIYHYDEEEVYQTKTGLIETTLFNLTRIDRTRTYIYGGQTGLVLRLESD